MDEFQAEGVELPRMSLAEQAEALAKKMGEGKLVQSLRRVWNTAEAASPNFALAGLPASIMAESLLPKGEAVDFNFLQSLFTEAGKFAFPKPAGLPTLLGAAGGMALWWAHVVLHGSSNRGRGGPGIVNLAGYTLAGASIGNHLE